MKISMCILASRSFRGLEPQARHEVEKEVKKGVICFRRYVSGEVGRPLEKAFPARYAPEGTPSQVGEWVEGFDTSQEDFTVFLKSNGQLGMRWQTQILPVGSIPLGGASTWYGSHDLQVDIWGTACQRTSQDPETVRQYALRGIKYSEEFREEPVGSKDPGFKWV